MLDWQEFWNCRFTKTWFYGRKKVHCIVSYNLTQSENKTENALKKERKTWGNFLAMK